jgi:predicted flap endonuclease-1-like 5' DNA nuclease
VGLSKNQKNQIAFTNFSCIIKMSEVWSCSAAISGPQIRRPYRQETSDPISNHLEDAMAKLIDVEGIGPANARKLKEAGIATIEALLQQGATPKGRKSIAEKASQ